MAPHRPPQQPPRLTSPRPCWRYKRLHVCGGILRVCTSLAPPVVRTLTGRRVESRRTAISSVTVAAIRPSSRAASKSPVACAAPASNCSRLASRRIVQPYVANRVAARRSAVPMSSGLAAPRVALPRAPTVERRSLASPRNSPSTRRTSATVPAPLPTNGGRSSAPTANGCPARSAAGTCGARPRAAAPTPSVAASAPDVPATEALPRCPSYRGRPIPCGAAGARRTRPALPVG